MSTTTTQPPTTDELSPKAQTLVSYLRNEVHEQGGEMYVKGKFISDDVDLSTKEIGALMLRLKNVVQDINIEKWSYTSATTWRITVSESPTQPSQHSAAD